MSAIALSEPPNPSIMRWLLREFDHRIDRLLEFDEARLVEAASEALDAGVRPLEIVTRVQTVARHRLAGAVAVNAVAAASHTAFLEVAARCDVATLVVACPNSSAGVGWLRRLGDNPTARAALAVAARDALDALIANAWWELITEGAFRPSIPSDQAGRNEVA